MKSAMDRPPCDSGFTLVEMLLVLLLLSVLLLVTPLLKRQQRILLRMDVQQIREICTKAQAQAIREHKSIPIKIQGSKVYCNREIYSLQSSTSCSSMSFHYTAQGTNFKGLHAELPQCLLHCSACGTAGKRAHGCSISVASF